MNRLLAALGVTLALTFSLVALLISAGLLLGLLQVRDASLDAVVQARTALHGLNDRVIETTVPLHHTFPIEAELPLRQDFVVPIRTTLAVSTVVTVAVDLPLVGTYPVALPVQANIPVDLEVIIPVSQTVPIETAVRLDAEVPIQVEVRRLGLEDLLGELDASLDRVEQALWVPLLGAGAR